MDEFDEFLNDLEETVAEEVEWGDDSSGSDAEADARAAAAPQPASVTAAVAAPSKMHTPYHGRKGSTSEAPSEEGKEGASAGNLPHVNSNATPASAEAALFAAVSMVKSEGQPRAEGVEGGEAGIQQPAGEAGQTQVSASLVTSLMIPLIPSTPPPHSNRTSFCATARQYHSTLPQRADDNPAVDIVHVDRCTSRLMTTLAYNPFLVLLFVAATTLRACVLCCSLHSHC